MTYSVDINRSVDSLAYCLQKVNDEVNNIWDWRISINAGGIDWGVYFNFDLDNREMEISNQPACGADESLTLEEIIEEINGCDEDED